MSYRIPSYPDYLDSIGEDEKPLSEPAWLVVQNVAAIVDRPDRIILREIKGTHSVVLELEVHHGDVGKVIGRKGVHADAIRRLLHAAAGKLKKRYVLEIIEDR